MRVNTGGPFKLRQTVTVANPVMLTMHGQGYGEAYPKLVCPSGAGISLVLRYLSIRMLMFEKVGRNKTSHLMQIHIQLSSNQTVPVRAERGRFSNEDDDGYVRALRRRRRQIQ